MREIRVPLTDVQVEGLLRILRRQLDKKGTQTKLFRVDSEVGELRYWVNFFQAYLNKMRVREVEACQV